MDDEFVVGTQVRMEGMKSDKTKEYGIAEKKRSTIDGKLFGMCNNQDSLGKIERKWRKREKKENDDNVCIEVNEDRRIPETRSISGRKNGNVAINGKIVGMCSNQDSLEKIERKRRKKEKNKNESNVRIKMNEDQQILEAESVGEMKGGKEVEKGMKSKELGSDDSNGYTEKRRHKTDGEEIALCSEYCEENDMEKVKRKKRRREKKQSKGEDYIVNDMEKIETKKRKGDKKQSKDNELTESSVDAKTGNDSTTSKIWDSEKRSERMADTFVKVQDGDFSEKVDKIKEDKKIRKNETEMSYFSTVQQCVLTEDFIDCKGEIQSNMENGVENNEVKKKKKTRREKPVDNLSATQRDTSTLDSVDTDGNFHLTMDQIHVEENDSKGKTKKNKLVGNCSNDPKPRKSNKKVTFSGHVEVFPASNDSNFGEGNKEEKLVQGKWFTPEEDEIVKKAVYKYIEDHDMGEERLYEIFNSRKYPEVKNCWKEIGNAIPYRPYKSVYYRASKLFHSAEERGWTQEEYEMVLKSQKEHGNQWKALSEELGKHASHVRSAWLRIKLPNLKKGRWSQEEYQSLFDLVNADLQQRVYEEKRSRHGMLRDNICWTAISDRLATRNQPKCCIKWYSQLTSPMVTEGIWADADDYRLIGALFSLDASCIEDVDWDNLLDHRSGDVCWKRWNQMVLHIGHHVNRSFAEQVEILAQRYCPYLLEAREAWDSKPRVP